jgi:16S rRNA (guanine527-N7)-methyltransferase
MTYDPEPHALSGPDGWPPSGPASSADGAATGRRFEAGGEAADRDVVPLPPELKEAARTLFGDRLALAATYAELLATDGVIRGLIGPREAPRIWARHLLNCAAVAELIPVGSSVLDVGSGAGLPGIVLAVARPDLSVGLVEPLARRTAFLTEAVAALGLDRSVTVIRARAEDSIVASAGLVPIPGDIVTARAVAPLDRLAKWCLPLTALGGRLLALKGSSAADEVAEYRDAVGQLGGSLPTVRRCGVGVIDPPTTVVEIVRDREIAAPPSTSPQQGTRSSRRSGSHQGGGRGTRRPR